MEANSAHLSCDGKIDEKSVEDTGQVEYPSAGIEAGSSDQGRAFFNEEGNLKFFPPLYLQRYETVRELLKHARWSSPISKVVEFGCAELAMFSYFKHIPDITEVLMVDIDSSLLEYYSCRAAPLTADYLSPRENPLHVEVLCGSVGDADVRLLGANAVVCIELIEHLELDMVEKMEKTIFGFLEPNIAIFTTPNSDFNVLLKGMQGKFRHWDHKFEWSRNEFTDWTNKVLSQYPHYRVEISGVGLPPVGNEDVGYCSQLALFIRSSDYTPTMSHDAQEVYTLTKMYDHPVKPPDTRNYEDKLRDEIQFHLNRMGYYENFLGDNDFSYIPLQDLTNAIQQNISTADIETIRSLLPPEDVVEKDGLLCITYNTHPASSENSFDDLVENHEWIDDGNMVNDARPEDDIGRQSEDWDNDHPIRFTEPRELEEFHMAVAIQENAVNLLHEYQLSSNTPGFDWFRHTLYGRGSDDDDEYDDEFENDEYESDREYEPSQQDCERLWNCSVPPAPTVARDEIKATFKEFDNFQDNENASSSHCGASSMSNFASGSVCAASSPIYPTDEHDVLILNTKREPITDSGVDLSPLLNSSYPQGEGEDILPCSSRPSMVGKTKELPKSTSVEVLHLDGSCTLKRRAGLEYVEFAPSTSVALCYTGQTYCDSDKIPTCVNMSMSSEHKSLDGSLVRDVADSYSLDFAGDSGYPNSSSLHHDIDVDLTPEQVDDISSENDERSEDELSELSDQPPVLPRRVIHPRHPIVPIIFENVENGDLANNNRDGEGNNAVAPLADEREFVALVQEGEMQPLLAAPVVEDIILPNNADPFPDWLIDLLRIEDDEKLPVVKVIDELDCDEGLGEDTV